MQIEAKTFFELSTQALYQIYYLRAEVFVVEQNCAYQDVDEKDLKAIHVSIKENDVLLAYSRILPPGVAYTETAIGRVVVPQNQRNKGYAKKIMQWCIDYSLLNYKNTDIVISAQTYLIQFYQSLGFVSEGEGYLEDNIPHQQMRLKYLN